ncbi:MAG: sulfatase [Oscillospiraceae bacterium]|nr:sulfatase [Oscillospiraceae bacterium]
MSDKRPNVVLLISHDTGRFYSPYGIKTFPSPHFDALAEKAVTFDRAFCVSPLCSPARSGIVTGRYPHQNGLMGLTGFCGEFDLAEKERHLARVFKESGYRTAMSGFNHETGDIFSLGFDEGIHGVGYMNNWGEKLLVGAGADIEAWLGRNPGVGTDVPFFIEVCSGETHRDWREFGEPYGERGVWKAPYLIDDPAVDAEMAELQRSCMALDDGLGEIVGTLERMGLAGGTIFAVTTDHGIDFPRAKGTLLDPGVGVGLFMRHDDGGWVGGARSDMLVSHVDLYPTLLEACGIAPPEGTAGISFLGALKDPAGAAPIRDAVFLEKTFHDNYDPMRAIRTDTHKYILNAEAQSMYDVRIDSAERYHWLRYPLRKGRHEELYDLASDPEELNNLADDPAAAGVMHELKVRGAKWMAETGDPLLDGPVPSPYYLRTAGRMRELAQTGPAREGG